MSPSDPLLTSLCAICHTNAPKYTCPRCASQTCSLPCSKRHKLWASCSGVRDPTTYVPPKDLYTAKMVDHDYNFLSKIERNVQKTDRKIVEDRGLFQRGSELFGEGKGGDWELKGKQTRYGKSWEQMSYAERLEKDIRRKGVDVRRAPRGMQRKTENGTSWSKAQKCINWTVEWMTSSGERKLGHCLEKWPVAKVWGEKLNQENMEGLLPSEKKRAREERQGERSMKRRRLDAANSSLPITSAATLQNSTTAAWDSHPAYNVELEKDEEYFEPDWIGAVRELHFYLLRPYTSAKLPKVLIPLEHKDTLGNVLRNKTILEFPTIYVLETVPDELGKLFMTEDQYVNRKRGGAGAEKSKGLVEYDSDDDSEDDSKDGEESEEEDINIERTGSDEAEDSDTSSSDEEDGDDEVMEDGEII